MKLGSSLYGVRYAGRSLEGVAVQMGSIRDEGGKSKPSAPLRHEEAAALVYRFMFGGRFVPDRCHVCR